MNGFLWFSCFPSPQAVSQNPSMGYFPIRTQHVVCYSFQNSSSDWFSGWKVYINASVLYMMSLQCGSFVTVKGKVVTFGFLPQEFFRMEDFAGSLWKRLFFFKRVLAGTLTISTSIFMNIYKFSFSNNDTQKQKHHIKQNISFSHGLLKHCLQER